MSSALLKSNAHLDFLCKILTSEPELVPCFPQVTQYHEENQLLVRSQNREDSSYDRDCVHGSLVRWLPDQHHHCGVAATSGNTLWPHKRSALFSAQLSMLDPFNLLYLRWYDFFFVSTSNIYISTVESTTMGSGSIIPSNTPIQSSYLPSLRFSTLFYSTRASFL